MRYPYYCVKCDIETEVEKPLAEIDRREECNCGHPMARCISEHVSFKGEKVEDNQTYFHPALGCEVRSQSHARQIAKSRGLVEVGNESQEHLRPKEEKYELTHNDVVDVLGVGAVRGG